MVGNEGEKSFISLFSDYYGGTHQDANSTGTNIDTHLLSSVFSFLLSGRYYWYNGNPYDRAWAGSYWSIKAYSNPDAHYLHFYPVGLKYQNGYYKGYGYSLR